MRESSVTNSIPQPPNPHHKSEAEEKEERDENLDKTIADSFPASDPPSSIPDPEDADNAA